MSMRMMEMTLGMVYLRPTLSLIMGLGKEAIIGDEMNNGHHESTSYLFAILTGVLTVLLGAVGFLNYVLHQQTTTKLDRMTSLFLHERDIMNQNLNRFCDQLGVARIDIEKLKMYHVNGKNGNGNGNGGKR